MRKFNFIFGVVLLIVGILTSFAWFSNVLPNAALIANNIIACIAIVSVTVQNYYYREWHGSNLILFWSIWSITAAVIALSAFYIEGFGILDQRLLRAIITSLKPSIAPILGILLGMMGKLIQEVRYSTI